MSFGEITVFASGYIIKEQRGEYCGPMRDDVTIYMFYGGKTKRQVVRFTKYMKMVALDESGFEDPFKTLLAGCFFETFYIVRFNYNKGEYEQLFKASIHEKKDLDLKIFSLD